MSYLAIPVPLSVAQRVRAFVAERVDLYLADVNSMLCLPLPVLGLDAGCNFAIVEFLCAVISGLSRVFRSDIHAAGRAFRGVLEHYPLDEEPQHAIRGEEFCTELYETYRCNLVHSLGVNVSDDSPRRIEPLLRRTVVKRSLWVGPPPPWVAALEGALRPSWLDPTLYDDEHGSRKLCAEALYWGTRRMVVRLCLDPSCAARADEFLMRVEALAESGAAGLEGNYPGVMSGADTNVSHTTGFMADIDPKS